MISQILRTRQKTVEIGVIIVLLALGVLIFFEGLRLGPGFGPTGPDAGFFPFSLTVLMMIAAVSVLYVVVRQPDPRTFFEDRQEIVDLLKVGIPVIIAMLSVRWLGLYIMAGVFIGFFAWWYDRFLWWQALAAGILIPIVLYLLFRYGFGIPMPTSTFYGQQILGLRIMI